MYVNYEYYANDYQGSLDEKEFSKAAPRAEAYIRYFLFRNAGVLGTAPFPELQNAICAAADAVGAAMKSSDAARENGSSGAVVRSESNDGYSVTYAAMQRDGESEDAYMRRLAYDAAYPYLLPTGLLYRGARCRHANECGYYGL